MAERAGFRYNWSMRLLFLGLAAVIVFFQLLPVDPFQNAWPITSTLKNSTAENASPASLPWQWPGPDLLLALTFVWVLRRPVYVPFVMVAGIFLLADFMFQRPPGLMAALVVIGTEWLKARARFMRDTPWSIEILMAGVVIAVVMICYRVTLTIFFLPQPPITSFLVHMFMTALSVPILMTIMALCFGLNRSAPGEVDELGHRV